MGALGDSRSGLCRCQCFDCVDRRLDCAGALQDTPRSLHFVNGSVNHQKELVGLERGLVVEYAVFGNADAVQGRANRAKATDNRGPFQGADDPRYDRTA